MSRNTFHTAAGRQVGLLPEVFPSLDVTLKAPPMPFSQKHV